MKKTQTITAGFLGALAVGAAVIAGPSTAWAEAPVQSANACDNAINLAQDFYGEDSRDHIAYQNRLEIGIQENAYWGAALEQATIILSALQSNCPQG